jgi:hypothetical protein
MNIIVLDGEPFMVDPFDLSQYSYIDTGPLVLEDIGSRPSKPHHHVQDCL